MNTYLQNIVSRIKVFSSQLDKKELFVDKLFHLVQENNEVHQYTFLRNGKLILSIDGKVIPNASWELLITGQLLINRGKDLITLDFDFLHPEILILKMGGTSHMPFIIYNKSVIEDGNVIAFLQKFEAKKTGQKIFRMDTILLSEPEINKEVILDENGKPFNGELCSEPDSIGHKDVLIVENGKTIERYFDKEFYDNGIQFIVRSTNKTHIQIGDVIFNSESILEKINKGEIDTQRFLYSSFHYYFNENFEVSEIKDPEQGWRIAFVIILWAIVVAFIVVLIRK